MFFVSSRAVLCCVVSLTFAFLSLCPLFFFVFFLSFVPFLGLGCFCLLSRYPISCQNCLPFCLSVCLCGRLTDQLHAQRFTMTLPITPYRWFNRHDVLNNSRVLRGIEHLMSDNGRSCLCIIIKTPLFIFALRRTERTIITLHWFFFAFNNFCPYTRARYSLYFFVPDFCV